MDPGIHTPPTPAGKAAPYPPHHIHIQPYLILYEYSSVAHLTNTTREPYDTYCAIHTVIPPPQHPNPRNNNTSREQGSVQVTPRKSDTAKSTLHVCPGNTKAHDNRKAAAATYSPRCIRFTTSPQPVKDTFPVSYTHLKLPTIYSV